MADLYTQGSESITQAEHISPAKTGDNIQAKRVVNYVWNGSTWERASSTSGVSKATAAYSISAISDDGTYKYFWFEDADLNYYIMRKNLTTSVFTYTKGTGGYAAVYQSSILGPSGSPTFASYGATF